jgi:crotonobetainyl-CoA:carnitine CoA-transferase CaiB-like acyl-CoA transferase
MTIAPPTDALDWHARDDSAAPLAGVRVIDFSELLPGPFLTQSLAELGADVIKIERPPRGDNARALSPGLFGAVNRDKRCWMVDLKQAPARAALLERIDRADVLVESFRPGVMTRLGLGPADVHRRNPRLVYVSLSGYGADGEWADRPGHDINYVAGAGIVGLSGALGAEPAQTFGAPVADLAGATYALAALNAALLQRERTGRGQHLDVSLTDCMAHWMNVRRAVFHHAGTATLDAQRALVLRRPAYGVFRCADGLHLTLAAIEQHFWLALLRVLDLGDDAPERWSDYARRRADAEEINGRIAAALGKLDRSVAMHRLVAADVPAMEVFAPDDLPSIPHFRARGLFDDLVEPALARFPVALDGMAPRR